MLLSVSSTLEIGMKLKDFEMIMSFSSPVGPKPLSLAVLIFLMGRVIYLTYFQVCIYMMCVLVL